VHLSLQNLYILIAALLSRLLPARYDELIVNVFVSSKCSAGVRRSRAADVAVVSCVSTASPVINFIISIDCQTATKLSLVYNIYLEKINVPFLTTCCSFLFGGDAFVSVILKR